jgi:membrane-associated phospholipid phosphatase
VGNLSELLGQLAQWDSAAIELTHEIHWGPLTAVFLIASAWWVKWPLVTVAGAIGDATRRQWLPLAALCATLAAGTAATVTALLKDLTDRARPPLAGPGVHTLIGVPDSSSFPSGHAATAFAAATAVGLLHPRLRAPLLALAAMVALSRVYLGVHYWSDVLVGSLLGTAVGLTTAFAVRLVGRARQEPAPNRGWAGTSFARPRKSPE